MYKTKLANSLPIDKMATLRCWGGGLTYGSICHFELGNKTEDIINGESSMVGSSTLWLSSDNWSIKHKDKEIANADDINKTDFSAILEKYFLNRKLLSIELKKKQLIVNFESKLTIFILIDYSASFDLMNLFLPDGQVIYVRDALYLSNQVSEIRKKSWQKPILKIPKCNEIISRNNLHYLNNDLRSCYA